MCNDACSLLYSLFGMGFGITSFFLFYHFQNLDAGSWALASAVFAAVAFHLHYLQYYRILDSWHDTDTLHGIQFLGVVAMVIGIAGTAWYIFNGVYYSIPIVPVKHSAFIASVWSFATAKWGMLLLIHGKLYTYAIRRENPRLLVNS